jgi:hypothetical protein
LEVSTTMGTMSASDLVVVANGGFGVCILRGS